MNAYQFGAYRLEVEERRLTDGSGTPVVLPPKVFDTLVVLVEAGGRLVTREDFQARLWGDTVVEERNLTVNISTLRKALNKDADDYIETVPRAGYRLKMPVHKAAPAEPLAVEPEPIEPEAVEPAPAEVPPAVAADVPRHAWPISPRLAFVIGAVAMLASLGMYVSRDIRQPADDGMSGQPPTTLAVLPFSVFGPSSEDGRLGLGLADAVISRLSQLPELTVRPTRSIRRYTAGGDLREIGRALSVSHVVEGVVQAEGERAKVTVKIVDVQSGATRWQEQFDRPFVDLFGLQEAVAAGVASSLVNRITAERNWGRPARRPAVAEAYRAYIDGKALAQGNIGIDMSGTVASFQRAVALDPSFAPAWAGLARSYRSSGYVQGADPHEFKDRARQAARRAIELDPDLPEAHTVLGILHFSYDWDWDGAERELRRAVELDPGSYDTQYWLGYSLYARGRFEEGLKHLQRANAINPLESKSQIGEALWFMGRIDEALGMLQETARLTPADERNHWLRVFVLDAAGRYAEANQARRDAARAIGDLAYLKELEVSEKAGQRAVFEQDLRLRQSRKHLGDMAWSYVQLGEPGKAIDALEACADQLCTVAPLLGTEVRFRSLHEHPRFQALLRRLRLDYTTPG